MRIVTSVRRVACAFTVLLLAIMLAACGGGETSSGGAADSDGSAARAPAPTDEAAGEAGARAGAAPRGNQPSTSDEEAGTGRSSGTENKPPAPPGGPREVVHSAQLRVKADDVEEAAAKAKEMATAAGGYVERETSSTRRPRSQLRLKIPADDYAGVLERLGTRLGEKISLRQEAEDVTGEVADVAARVRSAEATLESFRKLYERTGSISEIIRLEREIAQRESDLEALQARQKSLQHRTRFATVTVTIVSESTDGGGSEDDGPGGFIGGLQSGWSAFTSFVWGVAAVLGWLLPFAVAAALPGLPLLVLLRRRRRRKSATPEAGGSRTEPEQDAGTPAEPASADPAQDERAEQDPAKREQGPTPPPR